MAFSGRSGRSGSSSSSFASSSLAQQSSTRTNSRTINSTWTPNSVVSAITSDTSAPPTPLRPLDLGPPGYQATIKLFERTPRETEVFLGPWEVSGLESRSVIWQCSYHGETLEHFLSSDMLAQVYPLTLHSRHRPYTDAKEMERFVSFREPQRIRYTSADGTVLHDEEMEVKYEFTSVPGSMDFQGDLRGQDLIDWFDVDVIWSDAHNRTDSLTGAVRGLATIQRLKLWQDRYTKLHCITFAANRPSSRAERRFRDYQVSSFEGDLRNRDDRHRSCKVQVAGRRSGSGSSRTTSRSLFGRRSSRSGGNSSGSSNRQSEVSSQETALDIRWLGIQFSRETDYHRFVEQWVISHSADSEFNGIPFPMNTSELPSPDIGELAANHVLADLPELSGYEIPRTLPDLTDVLEEE